MKHPLINRTSPKGQKFVGTCAACGKPGLTFSAMQEDCENVRGMTQESALLEAVDPDCTLSAAERGKSNA